MFRIRYDERIIQLLEPCLDYFMQLSEAPQKVCKDTQALRTYLKRFAQRLPRFASYKSCKIIDN